MQINLIGLATIFQREAQRTLRVWIQSLMAPWISSLLYILVFGQIIGSRVSFFDGKISYIEFVFPGILTLNIINAAFSHAAFSVYFQRFTRHIEESLVAPLSSFDIVSGFVLGSLFRSLILAFGVLCDRHRVWHRKYLSSPSAFFLCRGDYYSFFSFGNFGRTLGQYLGTGK